MKLPVNLSSLPAKELDIMPRVEHVKAFELNLLFVGLLLGWADYAADRGMDQLIPVMRWLSYVESSEE